MWLSTMIRVGRSLVFLNVLNARSKHLQVVSIANARHVPAESDEARRHIIAVRERRVSLDGYVVVIVDPTEIVEIEVSCQRGCLAGDPFHHAAVAAQRVNVIVE